MGDLLRVISYTVETILNRRSTEGYFVISYTVETISNKRFYCCDRFKKIMTSPRV